MTFSREDLAAYEAKPQLVVPDPVIAKPAASTQATPQGDSAATEASSAAAESDQTESGDVTSDEDAATSTANATDEEEPAAGETEGDDPAEGDEPEEGAPPADGEESTSQPTKPLSRASKRIQELNAKMLEASDLAEGYKEFGKLAQEQLKAANEELARLRAGGKPAVSATDTTAAVPAKLGPMPKLTDPGIDFDPDILAEKTQEWTQKAIQEGITNALKATGVKTSAERMVETFQSRIDTFKTEHKDWDAKVKNPALPPLSPVAQNVLVRSDLGVPIIYHLASNIEEAKRIAALTPEEQVMEIGALKAQLSASVKAKGNDAPATPATPVKTPVAGAKPAVKKSVSHAPPPPTSVPAGRRSEARDMTDPTMDINEFARRSREEKQNARQASRRMRGLN